MPFPALASATVSCSYPPAPSEHAGVEVELVAAGVVGHAAQVGGGTAHRTGSSASGHIFRSISMTQIAAARRPMTVTATHQTCGEMPNSVHKPSPASSMSVQSG